MPPLPRTAVAKEEIQVPDAPVLPIIPVQASLSVPAPVPTQAPARNPAEVVRFVQKAGAPAKVPGDSAGFARRARAPSLKALEAAGLVEEQGAQLMTKELKEVEQKKSRAQREWRAAAAAAGLGTGEAYEALVPMDIGVGVNPSGKESTRIRVAGSGLGTTEGNATWRKLTAAEILQAAELRLTLDKNKRPDKIGPPTKQPACVDPGEKPPVTPGADADPLRASLGNVSAEGAEKSTKGSTSAKKRKSESAKIKPGGAKFQAVVPKRSSVGASKQRKVAQDPEEDGQALGVNGIESQIAHESMEATSNLMQPVEAEGMITTRCQTEDCARRATFGVNGTVRYW